MTPQELLRDYFSIDVSGNGVVLTDHYIRTNPKLITNNKTTEFIYVMNKLIPTWKEDRLFGGTHCIFQIEDIAYETDVMCICTQPIREICFIKHPLLNKSVQVGNNCVEKIRLELKEQAEKMQREKKKKALEDRIRCWKIYQYRLWQQHNKRERRLDKERDELVSKVEREHDDYIKDQTEKVMSELMVKCMDCDVRIIKDQYRLRCKDCFRKR